MSSMEHRAELAYAVFAHVYSAADSFETDSIGSELAYLMGAILEDSSFDAEPGSELLKILQTGFPKDHELWGYIISITEMGTLGQVAESCAKEVSCGEVTLPKSLNQCLEDALLEKVDMTPRPVSPIFQQEESRQESRQEPQQGTPEYQTMLRSLHDLLERPLVTHKEGDFCEELPEDPGTVHFRRKDGTPYMLMPRSVYEDLKKWKPST